LNVIRRGRLIRFGGLLSSLVAVSCGGRAGLSGVLDASADADATVDASSEVAPSSGGCGKPLPVDPVMQAMTVAGRPTGYTHYQVTGTGATLDGTIPAKAGPRTFWVRVPADYDPNHKYRVVYIGQGCGGYEAANSFTYQLFDEAKGGTEQAIYVALDIPRDMANQDCYDDRDGLRSQEWEAFELFHTFVDGNFCVDNDDVFITGLKTGGNLGNMWGCYFAGDGQHPWNGQAGGPGAAMPRRFAPRYHIRGQAVVSGNEPENNPPCNGPVAAIWIHDKMSPLPYAGDEAALARVLRMNGCEGSPTAPWHPDLPWAASVCVRYTACPTRFPVVFCTTSGYGMSDQRERAIPAFRLLFDEASGADAGTD
jgi:hypothetical protein